MLSTILLLSLFSGTTTPNLMVRDEVRTPPEVRVIEKVVEKQVGLVLSNEELIQIKAQRAKLDPKMMLEIAKCESGLRQYNEDGTPLISPTHDSGLFQINLYSHQKTAEKMGLDVVNSVNDNIDYAIYLATSSGAKPWYMSKKCHGY